MSNPITRWDPGKCVAQNPTRRFLASVIAPFYRSKKILQKDFFLILKLICSFFRSRASDHFSSLTSGTIPRERQIPGTYQFSPSKCCQLLPHDIRRKNTINNLNYYRILGNYYLLTQENRESEPVQGVFLNYLSIQKTGVWRMPFKATYVSVWNRSLPQGVTAPAYSVLMIRLELIRARIEPVLPFPGSKRSLNWPPF